MFSSNYTIFFYIYISFMLQILMLNIFNKSCNRNISWPSFTCSPNNSLSLVATSRAYPAAWQCLSCFYYIITTSVSCEFLFHFLLCVWVCECDSFPSCRLHFCLPSRSANSLKLRSPSDVIEKSVHVSPANRSRSSTRQQLDVALNKLARISSRSCASRPSNYK